jgi:hypothetical protein
MRFILISDMQTSKRERLALDGEWNASKDCCAMGYHGTWIITGSESSDEITIVEQPGSGCCGFIPNCFRKTHHMTKAGEGIWKGRLGFKNISLTVRDDGTLAHMTTDGPMTMTRA